MRFLTAFAAACLIPFMALAADLTIGGDTSTIEVERQIVVKDKLPLVKSLPFTVTAPASQFGYQWTIPPGVKAIENENVLQVTEARGLVTIGLKWTEIDFEAKKVKPRTATITFVAVDLKPPEPPDPLFAELKRLYDADPSADKAATAQKLAATYRKAAEAAKRKDIPTAGVLTEALIESFKEIPAAILAAVRTRIKTELEKIVPLDDVPLTDELRGSIGGAYLRVAILLEMLR